MNDSLTTTYLETHQRSAALHEEAVQEFAADGATHVARVMEPFRPYITHAQGSRKWDVDGNEYIDYIMGHGALILGHGHPAVVRAIREQASEGLHFGESHEMEVHWAQLISRMMPVAERVEFCASGQEANMMAIRLARVFTGRRKVLRFAENYHGWADELIYQGAPGCLSEEVTVVPFGARAAAEAALRTGEYALVLSEGGGGHMAGQVPMDLDFQRLLPEMARQNGTLYCVDEVVTGFRDAPGGWQALAGVRPDLSTIGKCAGGGLPVGAIVGREDVLSALDPRTTPDKRIIHAGTWNANPLSAAAGVAACSLYLDGEPQRKAREMARRFRDGGNEVLIRKRVSARLYSRSIVHLYMGPIEREPDSLDFMAPSTDPGTIMDRQFLPVSERFGLHLLQRGIAAFHGAMYVFSAAHTQRDVDITLAAFEASVDAMLEEGSIPSEILLS
ncbi:MAG: aminotransferase class III-fold pyridoxal phosphate-dependent enzyme [Dehalococcoidia bacterium]|nr:aminotransferase class III-fold pyridoxal phosphate-dependent enzyme [Dehalococcoidia bacterium]